MHRSPKLKKYVDKGNKVKKIKLAKKYKCKNSAKKSNWIIRHQSRSPLNTNQYIIDRFDFEDNGQSDLNYGTISDEISIERINEELEYITAVRTQSIQSNFENINFMNTGKHIPSNRSHFKGNVFRHQSSIPSCRSNLASEKSSDQKKSGYNFQNLPLVEALICKIERQNSKIRELENRIKNIEKSRI